MLSQAKAFIISVPKFNLCPAETHIPTTMGKQTEKSWTVCK